MDFDCFFNRNRVDNLKYSICPLFQASSRHSLMAEIRTLKNVNDSTANTPFKRINWGILLHIVRAMHYSSWNGHYLNKKGIVIIGRNEHSAANIAKSEKRSIPLHIQMRRKCNMNYDLAVIKTTVEHSNLCITYYCILLRKPNTLQELHTLVEEFTFSIFIWSYNAEINMCVCVCGKLCRRFISFLMHVK